MLEPSPVRTYEEVRLAIDSKLGSGVGLSSGEASRRLEPVEHVVWALDNLLACLFDFRLHVWNQSFTGPGYDGPRIVSAIAREARELDPLIADLLLWTAEWVKSRPVAMVCMVPELWALQALAARRFLFRVAERWPALTDPAALGEPPPFSRPELRVPRLGFTPRGASCPAQCPPAEQTREGVFRAVAWVLWQTGAADQHLEDFFGQYFSSDADEVDVVCRFVSFDGDGGDEERKASLRRVLHPMHPLAEWLGLEQVPALALLLVDSLEEVSSRLAGWSSRTLEGPDVAQSARVALRNDPDVLLVEAAALEPKDVRLLVQAAETGHLVVVAGRSRGVDALLAESSHVPAIDRRRS